MNETEKCAAARSLTMALQWLLLDYSIALLPSPEVAGVSWDCVKKAGRKAFVEVGNGRDWSRELPTRGNYPQFIGDCAQWIWQCERLCGFSRGQLLAMLAFGITEYSVLGKSVAVAREIDQFLRFQGESGKGEESNPLGGHWALLVPKLPPVVPHQLSAWDLSYLTSRPFPDDNYWSETEHEFIVKDSIYMVVRGIWRATAAWRAQSLVIRGVVDREGETHWADIEKCLRAI